MPNETQPTVVRNRLKRADILADINANIDTLIKDAKLATDVKNMITSKMAVSNQSEAIPPRMNEKTGELEYHCSRSQKFYPAELMVMTAEGKSKGYSIASQEVLTQTNAKLKEMQGEVVKLLSGGKTDEAIALSNEITKLTADKDSGKIYKSL